jgi:dTDP-4-dehydrorhamnose reductase
VRALITGGGGQLASDLEALLDDAHAFGRAELDITEEAAVARALAEIEPDVVFNCAAFHNVDVCETEEDRSFEVNARAVKRLAQRCAEAGATLVHYSTNYVFDGTAPEPYAEWDLPNPRSIYAISKLAGEYAALSYAPDALVVRSAGLYGLYGSASKGGNFVTRMVGRAREQGQLRMVAASRRHSPPISPPRRSTPSRPARVASSTSRTRASALGSSSPRRSWRRLGSTFRSSPSLRIVRRAAPIVR